MIYRFLLKRRILTPVSPLNLQDATYSINERFSNGVRDKITSKIGGVHVICGPPGCGKTTRIRQEIIEAKRKNQIEGALMLCGSADDVELSSDGSLLEWIREGAKLKNMSFSETLNSYKFDRPIVVVIDQFDHLYGFKDTKRTLVSLAENSTLLKKFTVILAMNDVQFAKEVVSWNGREKITHFKPQKWTKQELRPVFDYLFSQRKFTEDEKYHIEELGERAGTCGFVLKRIITMFDLESLKYEAESIHQHWIHLESLK